MEHTVCGPAGSLSECTALAASCRQKHHVTAYRTDSWLRCCRYGQGCQAHHPTAGQQVEVDL
jgi:hypothetical protein